MNKNLAQRDKDLSSRSWSAGGKQSSRWWNWSYATPLLRFFFCSSTPAWCSRHQLCSSVCCLSSQDKWNCPKCMMPFMEEMAQADCNWDEMLQQGPAVLARRSHLNWFWQSIMESKPQNNLLLLVSLSAWIQKPMAVQFLYFRASNLSLTFSVKVNSLA